MERVLKIYVELKVQLLKDRERLLVAVLECSDVAVVPVAKLVRTGIC